MAAAEEDLRLFYITAEYLERMRQRARDWSEEFLLLQLEHFRRTIPGYPEVHELLEGELHARRLNQLHRRLRTMKDGDLRAALSAARDDDEREIIATELEIRSGVRRLKDESGQRAAIQA